MRRTADARINDSVRIIRGGHTRDDFESERTEVRRNLLRTLPRVDSKYFYDDLGSHLFEQITRLPEYYQTRTEEALLTDIADEVAKLTDARELIELGSGTGRKVRLLLDAMQRRGQLDRCVLLDLNETFLRTSALTLANAYPAVEVTGIVGDFLRDLPLVGSGDRRLFIFLAGTIGNLYPRQLTSFLKTVRTVLGPEDAFLIGLDLVKETARLEAAYNDSAGVTADFNLNALRVLNRRFGTGFEIEAFEHVAFYDHEQEWIEMRLRALQPTRVSLGDARELHLETGDEIRTEISRKFTRESFSRELAGTGLELSAWFTDPKALFASALVEPAAEESPR
ncbi:MAG: L-histidine N(alpha)-methyltransferase [Acidobacteriota bacterium]